MAKSKYPILKTIKPDKFNVPECKHEDCTHVQVRRFTSVANPGMYWAIEWELCKACNALIRKVWYTPYKDYAEGIAGTTAILDDPLEFERYKVVLLLDLVSELLDMVKYISQAPPIASEEGVEIDAFVERMHDKTRDITKAQESKDGSSESG